MAMLEGEPELTLELLNRATQAWIEQEYHRRVHSEIQQIPLDRCLSSPSVVRPCPSSDALRRAFRMELRRKQRLSDGTITAFGVRYELLDFPPQATRRSPKSQAACSKDAAGPRESNPPSREPPTIG
jgi:hypothetical protein